MSENKEEPAEQQKQQSSPKTVNIYLVRHAESRYNDAKKNKNIAGFVGETDHGLSEQGVRQCLKLNSAIRAAAKGGDCADAKLILERGNTLSSPLSRAILTAHLALPMNGNDEAEGVEVAKGEGGEITTEEEKREQQRQHKVVALPEAREHCLMPVFAKDSIGTPRKDIDLKVAAELAAAKKIEEKEEADGIIDSSLPLVVDTSRIESDEWWIVGEKSSAVSERLGQLLYNLYEEADGRSGDEEDAVVLVAHSRVIRTLIRDYGDESNGEGKSIIPDMKEKFVDNCAVVRLTLQSENDLKQSNVEEKEEKASITPPKIVDAAFMFGTGFVEEKPKKKGFFHKR